MYFPTLIPAELAEQAESLYGVRILHRAPPSPLDISMRESKGGGGGTTAAEDGRFKSNWNTVGSFLE